ncbi:MAG: energy transducer TonB [Luteimonas sp.]
MRGSIATTTRLEPPRPDAVRIVGLSGTLAFNAMLFMVLLVPATQEVIDRALPDRNPELTWVTPPAPQPPRPPERVEVVKPPVVPTPAVPRPAAPPTAPVEAAVVVDGGTLPALPSFEGPAVDVATPVIDAAPLSGMALRYANAPAPDYPRAALAAGAEGVVLLEVHVGIDGRPMDVRIHRSSGNRDLDRAALRHVQRVWTFQPAMRDGVAVEAIGLVPIAFNLSKG